MTNWKEITKKELKDLFDSGIWYDEIGEMYGITSRAVRDKVKKFGIILERKNKKEKPKINICTVCGKEYDQSRNKGFCSINCVNLELNLKNTDDISEPTTDLGKNILELRKQGLSYNQISEMLNCSKATVSYHLSNNTKSVNKKRLENYREESL